MKKIQTFEQFSYIQEGNEAGFLQRDPMVGVSDMYKDMEDLFGSSFNKVEAKINDFFDRILDKMSNKQVESIAKKLEGMFGVPVKELTYNLILQKLKQNRDINESAKDKTNLKNSYQVEYLKKELELVGIFGAISVSPVSLALMLRELCDSIEIDGSPALQFGFIALLIVSLLVFIFAKKLAVVLVRKKTNKSKLGYYYDEDGNMKYREKND
jgi:hypothetical protein